MVLLALLLPSQLLTKIDSSIQTVREQLPGLSQATIGVENELIPNTLHSGYLGSFLFHSHKSCHLATLGILITNPLLMCQSFGAQLFALLQKQKHMPNCFCFR